MKSLSWLLLPWALIVFLCCYQRPDCFVTPSPPQLSVYQHANDWELHKPSPPVELSIYRNFLGFVVMFSEEDLQRLNIPLARIPFKRNDVLTQIGDCPVPSFRSRSSPPAGLIPVDFAISYFPHELDKLHISHFVLIRNGQKISLSGKDFATIRQLPDDSITAQIRSFAPSPLEGYWRYTNKDSCIRLDIANAGFYHTLTYLNKQGARTPGGGQVGSSFDVTIKPKATVFDLIADDRGSLTVSFEGDKLAIVNSSLSFDSEGGPPLVPGQVLSRCSGYSVVMGSCNCNN